MIDIKEKDNLDISTIPLKPLRKVRIIRGEYAEVLKESSQDYVKVILTDKKDLDVIDMQDRLRYNFPYLLEISRERLENELDDIKYVQTKEMNSYELCKAFLKDLNEEELKILETVINELEEE